MSDLTNEMRAQSFSANAHIYADEQTRQIDLLTECVGRRQRNNTLCQSLSTQLNSNHIVRRSFAFRYIALSV